jgi:hypothetical protein
MRLCEKWPVDASKSGRDLGTYIRRSVAQAFRYGETSDVNVAECERTYDTLARLNSNHYKMKYARTDVTGATGLTLDEVHQVNSTESMTILNKDDKEAVERLTRRAEEDQ